MSDFITQSDAELLQTYKSQSGVVSALGEVLDLGIWLDEELDRIAANRTMLDEMGNEVRRRRLKIPTRQVALG